MDIIVQYFGVAILVCMLQASTTNKTWNFLLFIPMVVIQLYLTYYCYFHTHHLLHHYFRIDHIGVIFLALISIIFIPTILHTSTYSIERKDTKNQMAFHNAALSFFVMSMTGVLISDHLGLMWAFLEGTTLVSAILIYHDRNTSSLEASWKYFFVSSIGLALAYVGILFLGIAGQQTSEIDLSVHSLVEKAPRMNPLWLKVSFLFAVVGFSVKMGVAPLFTVDIDAKDTAPSPVGAMFSGGLLNVGFLSIFRFYEILSATSVRIWTDKILVIIGFVSIFFAAVYLMKVKNFKRMLAYSSVEHAGIALIALGSGSMGHFSAVLHLIFHAFVKSSLFFQIGQVYRIYLTKNIDKIGNYCRINPVGGTVLLLGFCSVVALPPSGMFLSEYYMFVCVFATYHWIIGVSLIILLTFIFASFTKAFIQILFALFPGGKQKTYDIIHPWESISQILMLGWVVWMGISPIKFVIAYVFEAVKHLQI
jgi:hydrogenase-4 component F